MTHSFTLSLPWPPSMNNYWLSLRRGPLAGRVIISGAGKRYRETIKSTVRPPPDWDYVARMGVAIVAHPPNRIRRDLDNMLKPMLDALMHAKVFLDDSQIDELRITRGAVIPEGMMYVVIQNLSAELIAPVVLAI